jgi:hypothetical protein
MPSPAYRRRDIHLDHLAAKPAFSFQAAILCYHQSSVTAGAATQSVLHNSLSSFIMGRRIFSRRLLAVSNTPINSIRAYQTISNAGASVKNQRHTL